MLSPKVSVIMPVYNAEQFLPQAIESILTQTFTDFEFIIIDDGSTDGTRTTLEDYASRDLRISVLRQSPNQGIVAALNRGIKEAKADLIAIMHADDVSLPERLERQVKYLDYHPEVGLLGTAAEAISEDNKFLYDINVYTSPHIIHWFLNFFCPMIHPSMMIRKTVLEKIGFYSQEMVTTEDYDLWMRASHVTNLENLPNTLLKYRVWNASITANNAERMERQSIEIARRLLSCRLQRPVAFEVAGILRSLRSFTWGLAPTNKNEVIDTSRALKTLYNQYVDSGVLDPEEKDTVATDMALRCFRLASIALKFSLVEAISIGLTGLGYKPSALPRAIQTGLKRLR